MPSWAYRDISAAHAAAERERRAFPTGRVDVEALVEVAPRARERPDVVPAGEALARSHRMRLRLNATFVFEWVVLNLVHQYVALGPRERLIVDLLRDGVLRSPVGRAVDVAGRGGKPLSYGWTGKLLSLSLYGPLPSRERFLEAIPEALYGALDEALGESLFRDLAEHLRGLRHYSEVHVGTRLRGVADPTEVRDRASGNYKDREGVMHDADRYASRRSPHAYFRGGRGVARPRRCGQLHVTVPVQLRAGRKTAVFQLTILRLSVKVGGQACPERAMAVATCPRPPPMCSLQELLLRMNRTVLSDRAAGVLLPFIYLLERDRDAGQDEKLRRLGRLRPPDCTGGACGRVFRHVVAALLASRATPLGATPLTFVDPIVVEDDRF